MKHASLLVMFLLLTVASLFAQTSSSVPQLVHYSGTLTAANGKPVTEPAGLTFLIYSQPTGSEALWMETQEVHPDASGNYSVELGAASHGLPVELFATSEARWLGIQTPGQVERERQRLVSVPYALKAGNAETLGGLPLSAFVLATDRSDANVNVAEPNLVSPRVAAPAATTTSPVKIALTAPTADFKVTGSPVNGTGTLALNWTVPPTSQNVPNAIVKRDGAGEIWAGRLLNEGDLVVGGSAYLTGPVSLSQPLTLGGTAKGLRLRDNGAGVDLESLGVPLYLNWIANQPVAMANSVGIGTAAPQAELNLNAGGTANRDDLLLGNPSTRGLRLRDTGTGADLESIGMPLYVNYVTNQNTVINPNGGSAYIGQSSLYDKEEAAPTAPLYVGSKPDKAGYLYTSAIFSDDVYILGNLKVLGSKNFSIDHPLDPLNKTLDHAAIESSEVLNQYSGNATLDAKGEATVTFPDWFSSINTDFRYQLTAIGAPGPGLFIAQEVEGNSFAIAGGRPGGKVSWQVTAKRNDVYMQAHPFQAERQKSDGQRGKYTRPELYPSGNERQSHVPDDKSND